MVTQSSTDRADVAELAQCLRRAPLGIPARGDEALRAHLEMERQLVVDLALDVRAAEGQAEDASHVRPQDAWSATRRASALPTARAYRSHDVTSARSSARPARLSW